MVKTDPPNSHADRPVCKAMLPFRITSDDYSGRKYLNYCNDQPDGQHCPFALELGDPESASDRQYNSLGVNIFRLMRMYWSLEDEKNGWMRQRDELLTRVAQLEGELKTARASAAEYERKYRDKHPRKNGE